MATLSASARLEVKPIGGRIGALIEGVQLSGHANEAGEMPMQVNTSLRRRSADDIARVLLAAAGA